jgi:hypothetical protein
MLCFILITIWIVFSNKTMLATLLLGALLLFGSTEAYTCSCYCSYLLSTGSAYLGVTSSTSCTSTDCSNYCSTAYATSATNTCGYLSTVYG